MPGPSITLSSPGLTFLVMLSGEKVPDNYGLVIAMQIDRKEAQAQCLRQLFAFGKRNYLKLTLCPCLFSPQGATADPNALVYGRKAVTI